MKYSVVIVGGGIVGLGTALQLIKQKPSLKIVVLEKENELAKHQTGNNSGVIHSGIYYKPGSLKATNCLNGYHQLIAFCREQGLPFELCGKVIVATSEEEKPLLQNLFVRGQQNGLQNLRKISAGEIKEIEPHVNGLEGIFVPQTGIVDYKLVAEKYGEVLKRQIGRAHV